MSSILSLSIVKIRKPHQCFACFRKFPIGTEMQRGVFVEDDIYSLYNCKTCLEFFHLTHEAIRQNNGRIDEGWTKEYMNDDRFEGTPEEYLEFYKNKEQQKWAEKHQLKI